MLTCHNLRDNLVWTFEISRRQLHRGMANGIVSNLAKKWRIYLKIKFLVNYKWVVQILPLGLLPYSKNGNYKVFILKISIKFTNFECQNLNVKITKWHNGRQTEKKHYRCELFRGQTKSILDPDVIRCVFSYRPVTAGHWYTQTKLETICCIRQVSKLISFGIKTS